MREMLGEEAPPLKQEGGREWWKGVRIGEAFHPGPPKARRTPHENDPPWALQLVRATGAPARISLNQVGGGAQWRWQLVSQPRLSSSDRPTPESALQSWIDKHLQTLHADSQQALQNLQGQWRTQGLPHPQRPPHIQEEGSQREGEVARPPPPTITRHRDGFSGKLGGGAGRERER